MTSGSGFSLWSAAINGVLPSLSTALIEAPSYKKAGSELVEQHDKGSTCTNHD